MSLVITANFNAGEIAQRHSGKQEENESKDGFPQLKQLPLCLGKWLSG